MVLKVDVEWAVVIVRSEPWVRQADFSQNMGVKQHLMEQVVIAYADDVNSCMEVMLGFTSSA